MNGNANLSPAEEEVRNGNGSEGFTVPEITKIDAVSSVRRKRVACYVRVSTGQTGQDESYEIQQSHFENIMREHPEFELVGIYAERVSGTQMEARPRLHALMNECRYRRVDLVLTKSISRLSRNTADLLKIVRTMKSCGTDILFEREGIDTRTTDSELMLTLLASFAEQEARSISANNRWAIQKRFQEGIYQYPRAPYGYDLVNGGFSLNGGEAEIVTKIFCDYLSGIGSHTIAQELNVRGVTTKRIYERWTGGGCSGTWDAAGVLAILHNEAYTGAALLQKCYTDEQFQRRKNHGERSQYYIAQHHEPLVDRETFERARALTRQRRKEVSTGKRGTYLFSNKLICSRCGAGLNHEIIRLKGTVKEQWRCRTHRLGASACTLGPVQEGDLKGAFLLMLNKLRYCDLVLTMFAEKQEQDWREENKERLTKLEEQIKQNDTELDRLIFIRNESVSALEKRNRLLCKQAALLAEREMLGGPDRGEVDAIRDFLQDWDGEEFPEEIFRVMIEKVEVLDCHSFRFYWKCGLMLTEETEF